MLGILNRLSIFQKMMIAPAVGTALFILFLLLVYYQHNLGKATFLQIETSALPQLKLAEQNLIYLETIRNDLEDAVSAGERAWIENTERYRALIAANFVRIRALSGASGPREALDDVEARFIRYYTVAVQLSGTLLEEATPLSTAKLGLRIDEMREKRTRTEADFKQLVTDLETEVKRSMNQTRSLLDRLLALGALLGVFAVVMMGIITMIVALPTRRALRKVVDSVAQMAEGHPDFTQRIAHNSLDEVGHVVRQFNRFTDNLQEIYQRLEESSQRSERSLHEFKELINATIEGIVIVKDNICVDVNEQGLRMFGSDNRDDVVGQPMMRFIAPESRKAVAKHIHEAKTDPYEVTLFRHDGSTFPALVKGYDLQTTDGVKRISAVIDLSEIKENERMLEAQKNLAIEAQKKAIDATRTKSAFLANISHEIRTPMNGIIGMTYLVLKSELDEKQRRYLEQIDAASKSLMGIINDLLDVTKIEAGKLELEKIDFDIAETLDRIVDLLRPKADEKELEIIVSMDKKVHTRAHGDPLRLGQILTNLISNAIKFTEKGSVRIHVGQYSESRYRFEVIDTGIGMDALQAEAVFTPFKQADESISRRFGGTGLGLSITRQLCEIMQGSIRVESTPGAGSRFIAEVTLEAPITHAQKHPESALKDLPPQKRCVLLVEDNAMNREIAREMLAELNLRTDEAVDGEEALARYEADPKRYAVVLMDIQMPGMDGYTCTRELRKRGASMPIIALSANAMKSHIDEALEAGMDDHLAKPIDSMLMRQKIANYLFVPQSNIADSAPLRTPSDATIDFERGLYHVNSNPKLYAKTVRQFIEAYEKASERLPAMDVSQRSKWLHTQKGLAGTVGAGPLQQAIAELERQDTPENEAVYLAQNVKAVAALIASPYAKPSTEEHEDQTPGDFNEQTLLKTLSEALESQQPAKIKPLIRQLDGPDSRFASVVPLIEQYRYQEALDRLKELQ